MMTNAKDIRVAPIAAVDANRIVTRLHYSRSHVLNSQLHLGVFLAGRLEGALQFGPSLDKRRLQTLVRETPWNGFIELNRLAFSERLPRNSESRALGVALRLLRRTYPQLQWVVSFADATQCGDGAIYRAAGFVLTGIKKNTAIWSLPAGEVFTDVSYRTANDVRRTINKATATQRLDMTENGSASMRRLREAGARPLPGHQLRYVYFLDLAARARLTVPEIPFSEIAARGAGMYRGRPMTRGKQATAGHHPASDGAAPIPTLQSEPAA